MHCMNKQAELNTAALGWMCLNGIEELATLNLLQQQLNGIEQSSQKLNRWLNTKVDNLLQVINQSYQAAVKVEPYWL